MPLSKARDRERKKQERAVIRLDKLLSSSLASKAVQPKYPFSGVIKRRVSLPVRPEIDADGNVIPEY